MNKFIAPKYLVSELKNLGISNVQPYENDSWRKHKQYYTAHISSHAQVFIKVCENEAAAQHEFLAAEYVQNLKEIKSPKPLFFRYIKGTSFLVFEMLDNVQSLSKIKQSGLTQEESSVILMGLFNAIQGLHKANLIHRDIRPHNIMVNSSLEVFIIDFQFLIDKSRKNFGEVPNTTKKTLLGLWGPYARGYLWWDDAYSAHLIFDELDANQDHRLSTERKKLKELVGKTQAFGSGSTPFHFAAWCTSFLIQLLKFSHKALLYKTLFLFSKNSNTLKRHIKYKSRLKKLIAPLRVVKPL